MTKTVWKTGEELCSCFSFLSGHFKVQCVKWGVNNLILMEPERTTYKCINQCLITLSHTASLIPKLPKSDLNVFEKLQKHFASTLPLNVVFFLCVSCFCLLFKLCTEVSQFGQK